MKTVSLCMIVKNEERVLRRCLDSVADLVDEIIVVDTGSSDDTKKIAARYTDRIYDFVWVDDFSAARNFAFSKATMDYIYSADADEVLDEENRLRFRMLKESLDDRIDIVQMKYSNQLQFRTVYNFDEEYRPKLFKRLRSFRWVERIHETVALDPVVYDSDIVITHLPEDGHAKRDLNNFEKQLREGKRLSPRLQNFYARELLMAGERVNFEMARSYFEAVAEDEESSPETMMECYPVILRAARLSGDVVGFFTYALKAVASEGCSEVCAELGHFYEDSGNYKEAAIWYYNGAYEVLPVLVKQSGEREALEGLVRCYDAMGMEEQADIYRDELEKLG